MINNCFKIAAVCCAIAIPGSVFATAIGANPRVVDVSQGCRDAIALAGPNQTESVYEAQIAGGIETAGGEPAEIVLGLQTCMGLPGTPTAAIAAIRVLLRVANASHLTRTGAINAGSGRTAFASAPGFSGGATANYD